MYLESFMIVYDLMPSNKMQHVYRTLTFGHLTIQYIIEIEPFNSHFLFSPEQGKVF